jgi:uncharacterized Zn finger protein (UPF0148 family)
MIAIKCVSCDIGWVTKEKLICPRCEERMKARQAIKEAEKQIKAKRSRAKAYNGAGHAV